MTALDEEEMSAAYFGRLWGATDTYFPRLYHRSPSARDFSHRGPGSPAAHLLARGPGDRGAAAFTYYNIPPARDPGGPTIGRQSVTASSSRLFGLIRVASHRNGIDPRLRSPSARWTVHELQIGLNAPLRSAPLFADWAASKADLSLN